MPFHKIATNTYHIQVDNRLQITAKNFEYFTLSNPNEIFIKQQPMLNMALSEIIDLTEEEEFKAPTYTEALLNYFKTKRYHSQLEGDLKTIEIANKKAYYQKAQSVVKGTKIHHYFINIPLDDTFMLEISADVESTTQNIYEPLFWDAINSLELLGNYRHYIDISNKAFEERMAKLDALIESTKNSTLNHAEEAPHQRPEIPKYNTPEDSNSTIKLANFKTVFDNCKWSIPVFSKQLYFKINVRINNETKAIKQGLLSNYTKGIIEMSFAVGKIYNHGKAKGRFRITEGKATNNTYFRTNGLNYNLEFTGDIIINKDHIAILGHFHNKYGRPTVFPVEVYKHFNPNDLDWKNYRFSMEEAQQASAEQIQYLSIYNSELTEFPSDIFQYKNLKELTVFGKDETRGWYTDEERAPINYIPENIKQLQQLETLILGHLNISTLPEGITTLTNLKSLKIYCPVTQVPDGIFLLPKLEELSINGALEKLPETIDLPQLKSLSLANNQLKTMPEAFLKLKLRKLHIKNNPFKALAEGFKAIETDLSLEEKQRYFDWSYTSTNTNAIDQSNYYLNHYPKERMLLAEKIDAIPVLKPYKEFLLECTTMATYLSPIKNENNTAVKLGSSKTGGSPHLPKGVKHPTNASGKLYLFHAQINCEEVKSYQQYLPRKGMLYFYVNDEEYCEDPIVEYYEDLSNLERFVYTESHEWIDADVDVKSIRTAHKLQFKNAISLPETYNAHHYLAKRYPKFAALFSDTDNGTEKKDNLEAMTDIMIDFYETLEKPQWNNGHNNYNTHGINCSVFTQHESPQENAALKYGGTPDEWLVLLNLESIDDFSFWDAGTLTYCIHKKDLAIKKFNKIFTMIESS